MLLEKRVVTCFLESDGEILLLRRSERVGSYQAYNFRVDIHNTHSISTRYSKSKTIGQSPLKKGKDEAIKPLKTHVSPSLCKAA